MINESEKEKIGKFLLLFGLRYDYTLDELSSSYHVLAKLNHPDVNRSADSAKSMSLINEGYQYLKDALSRGILKKYFFKRGGKSQEERAEDIFYSQYKKGFVILKFAFEDYFGESEDKSKAGDQNYLKIELLRARIEFATLINDLPYNQWVNDAIDKISSINKWID